MKAKQDFTFHISLENGNLVSYKEGESKKDIKEIKVKKGDEIPKEIEKEVFLFYRDFAVIEYKNGVPQVSEELQGTERPPLIPKRKYEPEQLHKETLEELKKIGIKLGCISKTKVKLITEILVAQEKLIREGSRRIP